MLSFIQFINAIFLNQVDMIGQSIYDFSHPCDHDELRDALGLRTDGSLGRSFFLRLKSSLTVKGKSHNMKAASFKVNHFFQYSQNYSVRGRLDLNL